jgi:hypothetical protein
MIKEGVAHVFTPHRNGCPSTQRQNGSAWPFMPFRHLRVRWAGEDMRLPDAASQTPPKQIPALAPYLSARKIKPVPCKSPSLLLIAVGSSVLRTRLGGLGLGGLKRAFNAETSDSDSHIQDALLLTETRECCTPENLVAQQQPSGSQVRPSHFVLKKLVSIGMETVMQKDCPREGTGRALLGAGFCCRPCGVRAVEALRCSADTALSREHSDQQRG